MNHFRLVQNSVLQNTSIPNYLITSLYNFLWQKPAHNKKAVHSKATCPAPCQEQ